MLVTLGEVSQGMGSTARSKVVAKETGELDPG